MVNAVYPLYKQALLDADANVDLIAGDVKAILVDTADYTFSNAHDFLNDVPVAARVATSGNLASKTVTNGTFDCANFTWTAVTGDISEAVIFFIDTGVETTSRLVVYLDTGITGLPVTPNGGDINFNVDAAGVFTL
jgi:hypothetical protein